MSTMCSMLRWNSQKPQFQNRLLALCALQSRSLSGRHVSTGFLGPVLGAMMKQVCWHSRRSKADRGLPEARMAELLWKKPPLRTSTCGRHRFRRNHPLCEPRMWQGQVWEARPDGESTRGKAKFGKRHGSRKWEEENSATRRRHRGKGRKRQKTPLPPHTMCHTPHWASAGRIGRVAFYYFVFLKRRKCIRGHFLVVFGIRSGPSHRFSRIRRGIRRHPRVHWQICESKWLVFRTLPCDVAAQVDRNRKGL